MNKAKDLLQKYLNGASTIQEEIIIERWYQSLANSSDLNINDTELDQIESRMRNKLMTQIAPVHHQKTHRLLRVMGVAATVALIGLAVFFSYKHSPKIEPGSNKAVLTLADGTKINLDIHKQGNLANQNGISIKNQNNGWLQYLGKSKSPGINSLTIPKGGQYRLVLADGTRVWLNSETSIQYPTVFVGKTRTIQVKGEAFFEVAHDKAHPFNVIANDVKITVLGTSFNVKAYSNEKTISTSVLTGLVGVSNKTHSVLIKPGQQAIHEGSGKILTTTADLEEVVAWKDGLFKFNGMKLSNIAQQLSRWYNVKIILKNVPDEEFYGIIPRSEDISHVLEILEASGTLHFETSGHTITVTPKK